MQAGCREKRPSLPLRVGVLSACLLLPGAAFAAFAISMALTAHRTTDELRLQGTAKALSAAVSARIASYAAGMATLATSPLLDDPVDVEHFVVRARPLAEQLGGWIVVLGQGPDYPTMAHTGASRTALPDRLPSDVREAVAPALSSVFDRGTTGVSNLFSGPVSQRLALAVMVPIDRPGTARRALVLIVDTWSLQALLMAQNMTTGTFAAVADGGMRILASTAPQRPVVGIQAPGWLGVAVSNRSSAVVVGPGLSGRQNIYAVELIDGTPGWRITVAQPSEVQADAAWRTIWWSIAGTGTAGAALALAILLARREDIRDAQSEAAALRAGQASVARLHKGLPTVIFLRDVEENGRSRLLYRGGDLEAVLGWPASTFDGLNDFRAWTDVSEEDETAFLRAVLRDGRGQIEYRMRQPDGSDRWVRVHARLLDCRPGGGGEVVGYVQDVSAERAATARSLAVAQLAALGEISAALIHELRQPLATIAGAAENARDDAQQLHAWSIDARLERIRDQARRGADVLSSLRRFVRQGADVAGLEDVPLAMVVERCLQVTDLVLRSSSVQVTVELGGEDTPVVRAHPAVLEQVLSNLIRNACDALATQPASATRCIFIRAERWGNDAARLSVADTGGGIPPTLLPRLFSPFVTTKPPEHGTGLGLWISRSLVAGMGGSISVHNDTGGAVFEVTLPLGRGPAASRERPMRPDMSSSGYGESGQLCEQTSHVGSCRAGDQRTVRRRVEP